MAVQYGTVYPVLQVVVEKSAAYVNCTSFFQPRWWKDGHHVMTFKDNIKILTVAESDTGVYVCQGSYPNGNLFNATSTLLVASKLLVVLV